MKRILAVILACLFVVLCFTGCGATTSASSVSSSSAAGSPSASNSSSAAGNSSTAGEVVNITIFQRGTNGNADEAKVISAMNEYSAKKIGVTITYTAAAAAEYLSELSRKIAAKDDLDVAFVASYTGFDDLIDKGALLDITDTLKDNKYAELRAVMPEDIWTASSVNGKNYCVPNYKETPFAETIITPVKLADTIKEKYGVDFSSIEVGSFRDLDNLKEYLLDVKKEGIKYPALTNEQDMSLAALLRSDTEYELIGNDVFSPYVMNKETHKVSNMFNNPDFKSWFEEMALWNNLGLWSEDNISLDWDPRSFVKSTDYGIYPCNAIPDNANQQSTSWGHQVYDKYITPATILTTGTIGSTWAITSYSPKAEAAMKWIQLVETDHTYADMFIYGIEGVHYTRDSEDVVTKIQDSGWSNSTWKTTCFETPSILSTQSPDIKQKYRDFNASGKLGVLTSFTPNYDDIKNEIASVKAIYNEEYQLYTLGFYTTDNLPSTVSKYEAAGDSTIITELQKQIDAFLTK